MPPRLIVGRRGGTQVPLIVLSARADSTDKVDPLDVGAEDYATTPFAMAELRDGVRFGVRGALNTTQYEPKPAVQELACRSDHPARHDPACRIPDQRIMTGTLAAAVIAGPAL
jgi:DNA-binding response OmpR family regulator